MPFQIENINKMVKKNWLEVLELKSAITEVKKVIEGFQWQIWPGRKKIVNLKVNWNYAFWRSKRKKNGERQIESQRSGRQSNKETCIIVEGEKRDKEVGAKNIWRNNGQKLPKFDEKLNLHIQEIPCSAGRTHSKSSAPRHIIFKLLKAKDK